LSEQETALILLIKNNVHVVKDNGNSAKILVTEQAFDRELLLKEYDAQITVAIEPTAGVVDQKLNLSGSLRRKNYQFKCTSYCVDKADGDSGRVMRNKITNQLKQVIYQNRTQVNGLSYCDLSSYKPIDLVDVRPFLFKTEFVLKAWLIEHI
jgi:hypothetical protein